jgi:hypothetical protein
MIRGSWFSPVSTGELCPPAGLNPAHDCGSLEAESQVFSIKKIKKYRGQS